MSRVVVITGGGSGMGKAAAKLFAQNGDTVFILGRQRDKLIEVAGDLTSIFPIVCDITDLKQTESAIKTIVEQVGSVDVLINSAGGNLKIKTENPTSEQLLDMWREIIKINLESAYIVTATTLPHLNDNGRVILVGSSSAVTGSSQPGVTGLAYAAAKSGLQGFMRTLVGSLGERGITINIVAPGPVDNTDFFPGGHLPERIAETYRSKTPMPEFATAENVAATIEFLASKGAVATTGEIVNVSSGMLYSR